MSASQKAPLLAAAVEVRDERAVRANTALRVGTLFGSVIDSVYPQEYVAENFGVKTTNSGEINAGMLQGALTALGAAGGGVFKFGPGNYALTVSDAAPISQPASVCMRGAGMRETVLDFSGKPTWNSSVGMIRLIGAGRTNGVSVTSSVPLGSLFADVSDASGFAPEDNVQLRSTETYVIDDGGTRAEFLRVRYVDYGANRVHFTTPTQEPYDTGLGTVTLGKITFASGGWSDLTIKGKGSNPAGWPTYDPPTYGQWTGTAEINDAAQATRGDYGIECIWGGDLVFRNLRFVDVENQTIYLQSCNGVLVDGCSFEFNSIRVRSQYAVALYRCTSNVRIANNFAINNRHFVTTGSTASTSQDYFFGVPHNCTITGNIVLGSWQSGIDMHRSGHSFTITGNVIQGMYTAIKTRAARVTIIGNVCIGPNGSEDQPSYDGIQAFYNNTDLVISGNKIYGHACGIRVATPDADFENLVITNNIINDCGAYGIRVTTDAFTARRVKIEGNIIDAPTEYGVYPDGNFEDLSVSGNTISGGSYGIRTPVAGTRVGVRVDGNAIRGTTNDSIYLEACDSIAVNNNLLSGAHANGVHMRLRNCRRGSVSGNQVNLPAGASGGNGVFVNCTGSGTCSDLVLTGNQVYSPAGVGTGFAFDSQANQFHYIASSNSARTCATECSSTTDPTIRNEIAQRQSTTIASGVITANRGIRLIIVDTEASAASDDLDTISYTGREGDRIGLRIAADARDVVVKDGTGNIRCAGDCTLGVANDSITLEWRGSTWSEVGRSING